MPMKFPFQSLQHCTAMEATSIRINSTKCTYVHLYLFHSELSNVQLFPTEPSKFLPHLHVNSVLMVNNSLP